MNTLHFKYAVEVERTRSITQAAENLFMAQPNLSKAIKELEDTLGITIFARTPKGVTPTPKGAEFLGFAKNVLEQIDRMEQLYIPENAQRQRFRISIPRGSYISHAFTRFVAELDADKEIDVNVQETNSMQTIANVSGGQFDLGIIRYQIDYENYFLDYLEEKNLKHEPIWEFEYLALMSRQHPLATADKVIYDELSQYIEIVHGDTVVPYLPASKIRNSEAKKRIYVYERCSQFDMLSHIPKTYMWVSPIPDSFLKLYGLVQRKCPAANHKYKDLLVYPKGYSFTAHDKKFIDQLYASKNEVAFQQYN
jgi:DNA-binding transcriptional LysR family regulator